VAFTGDHGVDVGLELNLADVCGQLGVQGELPWDEVDLAGGLGLGTQEFVLGGLQGGELRSGLDVEGLLLGRDNAEGQLCREQVL
jgi:hypothetical protein